MLNVLSCIFILMYLSGIGCYSMQTMARFYMLWFVIKIMPLRPLLNEIGMCREYSHLTVEDWGSYGGPCAWHDQTFAFISSNHFVSTML